MAKNAILEKATNLVVDRGYRFSFLLSHGFYKKWSDEKVLKRLYKLHMHKDLNLDNPKTFNEKIQWLKLYDHKPIYTDMVDKYVAKQFVSERIGGEYIIPTLGVWDRFDDIDFDSLPSRFVLKCTHDSGGVVIVHNKDKLNKSAARTKLEFHLKRNFYLLGREWPYKNVKPRIIAEEYMEDTETRELRDYKFFCFNGVPKVMFVSSERQSDKDEIKIDFFDMEYNHLPIRKGHPNAPILPKKPKTFETMKAFAEKLSSGIPLLRVDFYEANGRCYFGELTFFSGGGMGPFDPEEWDYKFGEWITLPEKNLESVK